MKSRKKGLGKGLDALLSTALNQEVNLSEPLPSETPNREHSSNNKRLISVPLELCQRGKYQPRKEMAEESLNELAHSIKNQGVIQPIILRSLKNNEGTPQSYEIIAGERRWRAAQIAGLSTIPAIIRDVDDSAASAMALVENLQREDLNPIEEAYALHRLTQDFSLTHQQVSDLVGKSRVAVSNLLRLTSLAKEVKEMLGAGSIDMGHARALLSLSEKQQIQLAKHVLKKGLSVRQTEALAKKILNPDSGVETKIINDPNIDQLQIKLSDRLGVPVTINHQKSGSGRLVVKYHSLDELDGVLKHIK